METPTLHYINTRVNKLTIITIIFFSERLLIAIANLSLLLIFDFYSTWLTFQEK